MLHSLDIYLGSFLVLCGFVLSLLNLKRVLKENNPTFSYVLLSENIMLLCIGIAFIIRAVQDLSPMNVEMENIEERSTSMFKIEEIKCNFGSLLMSYGPLIISLVNSFLSLIIDNYLHYKMLVNVKQSEEENEVRELSQNIGFRNSNILKSLRQFWKKNFTYITIGLQWFLPVFMTLIMYTVGLKEKMINKDHRSVKDTCMALLDISKKNCTVSQSFQLSKNVLGESYLEMYDFNNVTDKKFDNIVNTVYKIVANYKNDTNYGDLNVTAPLLRIGKGISEECMKICYLDNKNLMLYIFGLIVFSYFAPITVSIVILTRIHVMNVKKENVKMYISRELLFNILFWTPVMFDTFISITVCSYSMNGLKTSILNIIANVYQAVKNFMNTKYFKDNVVAPI